MKKIVSCAVLCLIVAVLYVDSAFGAPVHRFYNFKNNSHFYTVNQPEATYINDNLYATYRYEGVDFSAYEDSGYYLAKPVYRFFHTQNGFHFYTKYKDESNYIQQNLPIYRYEGEAYYAVETATVHAPGPPQVFRYYNLTNGAHFYTANKDEQRILNNLPDRYRNEGYQYYSWGD